MSLLARLAPHLPYLRRYARALTGDQKAGDVHVRLALESLATGQIELDAGLSSRVAAYRAFHAVWMTKSADPGAAPGLDAGDDNATGRLMRITPRSRQAFLLTALEGFTPSEAARILAVDFAAIGDLLTQAQAEIDAELATEVLIIEDEPVIAADIESLVSELGHRVTDIAATHSEAVASVARAHDLPVPFFANSAEDRSVVLSQPGVQDIFDMSRSAPLSS